MEQARPLQIRPLEWARDQSASAWARAATAWKPRGALKRRAPLLTGASRNIVMAAGSCRAIRAQRTHRFGSRPQGGAAATLAWRVCQFSGACHVDERPSPERGSPGPLGLQPRRADLREQNGYQEKDDGRSCHIADEDSHHLDCTAIELAEEPKVAIEGNGVGSGTKEA